jgi:triosephosphate isomerase (TIM)
MTPSANGDDAEARRRPYVAANWKMWGTQAEVQSYVERLLRVLPGEPPADVTLCVPFTALATAVSETRETPLRVAAQNMHQEQQGAYTGEVSAPMLVELGVDAVVLGHSERRQYNCESDRALQQKLPAALAAGLEPILCVGETEEEREAGETERKLRTQVQEALEKVPAEGLADVVLAYEPIWAIGTGRVATAEQAEAAIAFVRALVGDRDGDAGERVRVLYGGSVKPDNAAEILSEPDVDGALVGGASLNPRGFAEIVAAAG